MGEEIRRASVTIRAVAETRALTLGDVADLHVGQILKLQATANSRIKVESAEQPLFWAYLGQNDGYYTLCIDETFDRAARVHQRSPGRVRDAGRRRRILLAARLAG